MSGVTLRSLAPVRILKKKKTRTPPTAAAPVRRPPQAPPRRGGGWCLASCTISISSGRGRARFWRRALSRAPPRRVCCESDPSPGSRPLLCELVAAAAHARPDLAMACSDLCLYFSWIRFSMPSFHVRPDPTLSFASRSVQIRFCIPSFHFFFLDLCGVGRSSIWTWFWLFFSSSMADRFVIYFYFIFGFSWYRSGFHMIRIYFFSCCFCYFPVSSISRDELNVSFKFP